MMPGGCFHSRVEGRCSRCQRPVDSLHMPLEVAGSVFCGMCCPLCKPMSKRKRDWHGRYASEGAPPPSASKNYRPRTLVKRDRHWHHVKGDLVSFKRREEYPPTA